MPLFLKNPVLVEAVQFEKVEYTDSGHYSIHFDTTETLPKWLRDAILDENITPAGELLLVETLHEGGLTSQMRASPGDWIIRSPAGELYVCSNSVFVLIYDPADEQGIEVEGVAV